MATGTTADDASLAVAGHFLRSLERADHARTPFAHWLLENALPEKAIDGIVNLPVAPPQESLFNGTRSRADAFGSNIARMSPASGSRPISTSPSSFSRC
jgi:hypothetical protein